jgi:hypothetical protein
MCQTQDPIPILSPVRNLIPLNCKAAGAKSLGADRAGKRVPRPYVLSQKRSRRSLDQTLEPIKLWPGWNADIEAKIREGTWSRIEFTA